MPSSLHSDNRDIKIPVTDDKFVVYKGNATCIRLLW